MTCNLSFSNVLQLHVVYVIAMRDDVTIIGIFAAVIMYMRNCRQQYIRKYVDVSVQTDVPIQDATETSDAWTQVIPPSRQNKQIQTDDEILFDDAILI